MIMGIKDIAKIVNACEASVRTLLGRAEFNKHCLGLKKPSAKRHKCRCYEVDDAFITRLKELL